MSPKQQKVFFDYFEENGFILGESKFRKENPETYQLRENEKWNKKRECIVEEIIEVGLCNDYKLRDELNIQYFIDLEEHLPEWPWAFKLKRKKGFFE